MIKDSLIVGHSELRDIGSYQVKISTQSRCTKTGIMLPFSARLTVSNVTMVNFDESGCISFGTCAHCKPFDGAAIIRMNKLNLIKSPNLVTFPYNHASVIEDEDGTLSGHKNGRVLPFMNILDRSKCPTRDSVSFGVPGAVCEAGATFAKIAWNSMKPSSIDEKDAYFCNKHGCDTVIWRKKTKSGFMKGYTSLIPINDTLTLTFQNSTHFTNISYSMGVTELGPYDHLHLKHMFKQTPDYFTTTGARWNNTGEFPLASKYAHGRWNWEKEIKNLTYLVDGQGNSALQPVQKNINLRVYRCFYEKCIVPTPPPAPKGRPATGTREWSKANDWEGAVEGFGGHNKVLPKAGEDVMINSDWWMIVDTAIPKLKRLYIYGTLEIPPGMDHKIQAEIILISGLNGNLIVGWPDKPMVNNVIISLLGNHDTKDLVMPKGPVLGAKALGVFGRMQLFGK